MKASVRLCRSGSMDISLSCESECGSSDEELKEFVQRVASSEGTLPSNASEHILSKGSAKFENSNVSQEKSLPSEPTIQAEVLSSQKSCSSNKGINENCCSESRLVVSELSEPPAEFLGKRNSHVAQHLVQSISFEDDISAISNDEDTNPDFFDVDSLNGDNLEEKLSQEADQLESGGKGLHNQNKIPNGRLNLTESGKLTDYERLRTMLTKPMEEILRLDEKVSKLKADIQKRLARHMQQETEPTTLSIDEQEKAKHYPRPLAHSHLTLKSTSIPPQSPSKESPKHSGKETEVKKPLNLSQAVAGGPIKASGQHQISAEQPNDSSLNSDHNDNLYSFEEKSNMEPENEMSGDISSPFLEAKDSMAHPKRKVVEFSSWKSSFDATFQFPEMGTPTELSYRNRTAEILSMIESLNNISIEQFRHGRWSCMLKKLKGIVVEQEDQVITDITLLEQENDRLSNAVQVLSKRLLNSRAEINRLRDEARDLEGKNFDLNYSLMSLQLKDQERIQKGICALRQALRES